MTLLFSKSSNAAVLIVMLGYVPARNYFLKGCFMNQHLFLYAHSRASIADEHEELFFFKRKCGIASAFLPRTLAV